MRFSFNIKRIERLRQLRVNFTSNSFNQVKPRFFNGVDLPRNYTDTMARPTGLIATKGIELLTWATPNGFKASVLLEELKEAYGLDYTSQGINIGQNIQKEPWFIAVNPNGRIPAIVDHDNNDLAVFEGNAILSYLTRKYDTDKKFSFSVDDDDYTRAESWIGWQHGGLGPM